MPKSVPGAEVPSGSVAKSAAALVAPEPEAKPELKPEPKPLERKAPTPCVAPRAWRGAIPAAAAD